MSEYTIRPLDRSYNREMLAILQGSPVTTQRMTICFDRQPNIFNLADCKYNEYFYLGLFRGSNLQGFGMVGYHTALVNGDPCDVYYCRDLYVLPEARGHGFVNKSVEWHFREHPGKANYGYGLIMEGNQNAERLIGKRPSSASDFPYSRKIGTLQVKTILLFSPVRSGSRFSIRKATKADIPRIVNLLNEEHRDRLFGAWFREATFLRYLGNCPGLTIEDHYLAFDKEGKCCGVCAAWDTGRLRQNRIVQYGRGFRAMKLAYSAFSLLSPLPPLPHPGEAFRDITITHQAVSGRNPEVMSALLRTIHKEYRRRGYHFMVFGTSTDDPAIAAANDFSGPTVRSNIILFSLDETGIANGNVNTRLPYIDVSAI